MKGVKLSMTENPVRITFTRVESPSKEHERFSSLDKRTVAGPKAETPKEEKA